MDSVVLGNREEVVRRTISGSSGNHQLEGIQ